jgi:aldehyde:ferredoxin oxidoreductase
MCNELGLDVFMVGYTIAWAMECFEKGIITIKDTDGIELTWGNHEAVLEMIRKIAYRDGFGGLLAGGIDKATKNWGKDLKDLL